MTESENINDAQHHTELHELLNPQGVLYHYTDQQGLLGILNSRKIWASHIRYLNDTKEYYAGRSFVERVAAVMKEQNYTDEKAIRTVEDTLKLIDTFDVYVSSFSKADEGDSLNLWRAYARNSPGFSIGFDAKSLNAALHPEKNDASIVQTEITGLFGVQYIQELGNAYQIKKEMLWLAQLVQSIISDLLKSDFDTLRFKELPIGNIESKIRESMDAYSKSALAMAMLIPLLKHGGFSGEQESRLVRIRAKDDGFDHCSDINFRPGCSSVVPYLAVDLPLIDLGIRKIVVGPCPDPDWAVHAVEMLLTKNRIQVLRNPLAGGVKVDKSKIPYRNW